jgi:hypothetical protein
MVRRQPKADIDKLIKKLWEHYHKPRLFSDTKEVAHNAMTEDDVERVVAMAKPLYDLANGVEPILRPMTEEDAAELITVLHGLRVKVDRIERIPLRRPAMSGCADWLISEESWHQLIFGGIVRGYDFNRNPLDLAFAALSSDSIKDLPGDIEPALCKQCEKLGLDRSWKDESWLIGSLADYLVTPDEHDGKAARKKAARLEKAFPYLVRWHILGFRKDEKATLCVLVP